jgi:hypothetical protein
LPSIQGWIAGSPVISLADRPGALRGSFIILKKGIPC